MFFLLCLNPFLEKHHPYSIFPINIKSEHSPYLQIFLEFQFRFLNHNFSNYYQDIFLKLDIHINQDCSHKRIYQQHSLLPAHHFHQQHRQKLFDCCKYSVLLL